jgi:hypothetical protein
LTRRPFDDEEVVPFVAVEIVEVEMKVRFLAGAESEAYCSTQAGFFRIRGEKPDSEHKLEPLAKQN